MCIVLSDLNKAGKSSIQHTHKGFRSAMQIFAHGKFQAGGFMYRVDTSVYASPHVYWEPR